MTFEMTLAEHLSMAASASMCYIAIDYKNELNMKVATSNANIKIHFLNNGFLVSAWPLHSGKPHGTWHKLALE